jgi:Site-specific recombinase XerD
MYDISAIRCLLPSYSEALYLNEYAENSIRGYISDINLVLDFLALEQLTFNKESLLTWKELQNNVIKSSTINRKIAALNNFFDYLNTPELRLKQVQVQESGFSENALTKQELDRLLNVAVQAGKLRISMIILVLVSTGIRIGELPFFTVEAVETGIVPVNNKKKERPIVLSYSLQSSILDYCQFCGISSECIFINKKQRPLSRSYIASEMKRLAQSAGIYPDKVHPHNLRHYFSRRFLEQGYPLTDLADHLGHEKIDTTRRYLRVTYNEKRQQMSNISNLINASPLIKFLHP